MPSLPWQGLASFDVVAPVMAAGDKKKYIQDPLYGMVHLSNLEMRIIDSRAFQRLLSVKQLGYAYAVFPGADYSRFSHSVGACAIMGRWLDTLSRHGSPLQPAEGEMYRLAALMHDIGHYPFSHATERAADEYYNSFVIEENEEADDEKRQPPFFNHERLGAFLVEKDEELREIVTEFCLSIEALQRVFKGHNVAHYSNLLSADVDADRLDYLLRTAHHTGMPYGRIDQQYLLTEIRIDSEGLICWTDKALSSLDQILIARYFDYQQIVFNKTVVALELVLERIVERLLRKNFLDFTLATVQKHLKERDWISVDDHYLFQQIRDFQSDQKLSEPEQAMCRSILQRNPPRRVAHLSFIDWYDAEPKFKDAKELLRLAIPALVTKFGIPEDLWFVWGKAFRFTDWKNGIDVDEVTAAEELSKIPRILRQGSKKSTPIIKEPESLIREFYAKRRYDLRLYVLIPEMIETDKHRVNKKLREEIEKEAQAILTGIDKQLLAGRHKIRFPGQFFDDPTLF